MKINNKINESFMATIAESKLPEALTDIAEVSIDDILERFTILKEIPVLGVIIKLFSTSLSIRDYIFMSKILSFLKPIDEIDLQEREKMLMKLQLNEKYNGKVGDRLIMIIERLDNAQKARLLGVLFKKSLEGKIDYETFLRYSAIVDKIFLPDLRRLPEYHKPLGNQEISASLYSLGLIIRTGGFNNTENEVEQDIYKLSLLGRILCELLKDEW